MTSENKAELKRLLANCLQHAEEVQKVVVFGSFQSSEFPSDMDVAVFVNQEKDYLPLAMKLRRMTKAVSKRIPLDIIPVRPNASGPMLEEINLGEVIYQR